VHVKKLTRGNRRTSAFSLAAKGRVVAEKRATLSSFKSPFPRYLNALYYKRSNPLKLTSRSKSKLCYDRWSVNQSVLVSSTPSGGPRPDFYYCQIFAGLLTWGALSDERTSLSFITAAGSRQRSLHRARVPRDS
jgi:hypothetical protein